MPFADELLGTEAAAGLVDAIAAAAPEAELTTLRAAVTSLGPLALRERSDLLRDALLADLPGGYDELAAIVRAAMAGRRPFTGWMIWPVTTALVARAIDDGGEEAFDHALDLLAQLTSRLTAEFAIRGLLDADLDRALGAIQTWTTSGDEHVRRLASEGTRPFLPWAKRVPAITADPERTIPILDALHRDESEYVRRSVANHLNDISRLRPDLVVATAARWSNSPDDHTAWIVRHSLRTLVKAGDPGALALLGFSPAAVDVDGPTLSAAATAFDGSISFVATITNTGTETARLAVDYLVHHRKANGGQTAKTFKLTTATLAPGERLVIDRSHSFRPITTRRYHAGDHAIELQVNGIRHGRADFVLEPPT